ncbi:RNA polymerase sigma factor [Fulvivirga ligni]|uniref:RNA polymerase sigma factor n=1 Tax=Fulvivirga ligni TaxID=2904246 RepID=UPI002107BC7D|nr:sigma-70 family RNA polymerase sigma factor [Fulvivirga ligni]
MTKTAFLNIIEQNQNLIYKICRMYRDTKEDQEDLFQDIVYQLVKAFPEYRQEAKISTWMYRIALNTALATFRKKKVSLEYENEIPEKFHPHTSEGKSEKEELMYWALKQLSLTDRAIISLYLEDYNYDEIADVIGITNNYVGVKINRIKEKLKTLIARNHD